MKTRQTSIAIINDISGYGRCSVTVALPILSALKVSCGIVPTAILSNQTEYPCYTMLDFTGYMEDYIATWKKLNLSFDGLYTGFLGSHKQIDIILHMIQDSSFSNIIVDPVMGDHGQIYDSYTNEMCQAMKELVKAATIITPNVTELCILTDQDYTTNLTIDNIKDMCRQITHDSSKKIIVTGIEKENLIGNAIYENGSISTVFTEKILPLRPGTGDVFASIVSGCVLNQISLNDAVILATDFIRECLLSSKEMNIPPNAGVCIEEHLSMLTNFYER